MKITLIETNNAQISGYDRAIQFGDAHFTTLTVREGVAELWSLHLKRLQHASDVLGFADVEWDVLAAQVHQYAQSWLNAVMKIIISRGESQRGYAASESNSVNVYIYKSPYPSEYINAMKPGVELETLNFKLGHQPYLAGLKHCNRLEQVLIKQEITQKALVDGLVCDIENNVIETSVANVFFYQKGTWFTPKLSLAGIAGVMRQHILSVMGQLNLVCHIKEIPKPELLNVDSAFICNALLEIVPITAIDQTPLSLKPVLDLKAQMSNNILLTDIGSLS